MAILTSDEKIEFLRLVASSSMKEDMQLIAAQRHNPVAIDGKVNMDRALEFLTQFNEFINHKPKPFEPIVEREMKL